MSYTFGPGIEDFSNEIDSKILLFDSVYLEQPFIRGLIQLLYLFGGGIKDFYCYNTSINEIFFSYDNFNPRFFFQSSCLLYLFGDTIEFFTAKSK